jgi:hypothetical protein
MPQIRIRALMPNQNKGRTNPQLSTNNPCTLCGGYGYYTHHSLSAYPRVASFEGSGQPELLKVSLSPNLPSTLQPAVLRNPLPPT